VAGVLSLAEWALLAYSITITVLVLLLFKRLSEEEVIVFRRVGKPIVIELEVGKPREVLPGLMALRKEDGTVVFWKGERGQRPDRVEEVGCVLMLVGSMLMWVLSGLLCPGLQALMLVLGLAIFMVGAALVCAKMYSALLPRKAARGEIRGGE